MEKTKRTKLILPAWMLCLTGVLAVWIVLSGVGYALSGATTLNENIGSISITAALPVTYTQKLVNERPVQENGEYVYEYVTVSEEDAVNCVAWDYDSTAKTISGVVCARYNSICGNRVKDMQSVKADLVFTNTHETNDMILSFDYLYTTTDEGGSLSGLVSGANIRESGNVTVTVAPGESKSISIYSGSLNGVDSAIAEYGKVTLNLSNITVTDANATFDVTLKPANYGTYQASFTDDHGLTKTFVITNQAITPELEAAYPDAQVVAAAQKITFRLSGGLELKNISANANFRFDHWQAGNNSLGTETTINIIPADGSEVTAVFLQKNYINAFTVGNKTYYSWNSAVGEALTSHNPIILNQDYTFPATMTDALAAGESTGNYVAQNGTGIKYIVPTGVKFVVPKSENDFGNFTNVLPDGVDASDTIAHFRTLTVPGDVTLQINGDISVNGDYFCSQPYETVAGGKHGLVSLNEGAKISVGDGGKIWCYGFIAGAGEVEIASGGHAAELLQICDWGGGSAAFNWASKTENYFNAFYFSQYYVQNIEATMTVHAGATTEVAVVILASNQYAASHAPFIGEGGMFHLKNNDAYIQRVYNRITDRVNYNIYGDMDTSGITVNLMDYQLASDPYVLGINGNLSINVEEGKTTLLNDFMLLPGTEINVASEASVEIAQEATANIVDQESGTLSKKEHPVRLFIIDDYEWNYQIPKWDNEKTDLENYIAQLDAFMNPTPATYTYGNKNNLPYTIANGTNNKTIRSTPSTSATINVDGEATFYSNVFTTNYVGYLYEQITEALSDPDTRAYYEGQIEGGATAVDAIEAAVNAAYEASKDKLITGSGTIINNEPVEGINGTLNLLTQSGSVKNQVEIPTAGCLVDLNGDGTYSELGTGTYESAGVDPETGETLWYKNQITYHFVVIDPATQSPTGVLPDVTRKSGVDYDVLTAADLTVGGQRYAIFGFDASTLQTTMHGVPIGFVAENGEVIKDGNFNLEGDSQNRNFVTPASWNALTSNSNDLMTYVMSNGITSGWDTMGFVFADLTKMSGGMSSMLSGGLNSEITVYVVAYDHYVAFENKTTGERAQSYLPSGVTSAQYTMTGEASLYDESHNLLFGPSSDGYTLDQKKENMETTLFVTDVNSDVLISMIAGYSKVQLTWVFQNDTGSTVYDIKTTIYEVDEENAANSPTFENTDYAYFLIHGDQNIKLADRYNNGINGIVTLSNETLLNDNVVTGSVIDNGKKVSLVGIPEPLTIKVNVDAYNYKLSFTDNKNDAAVEDFYVKDGDSLVLTLSNIVTDGKYCFDTASVTSGTATATVQYQGAELAITSVSSDAVIALTMREYNYLIQYYLTDSIYYDFVTSGGTSVYTYPEGYYDGNYAYNGSPNGAVYTHALEGSQATLTVDNVSRDNSYTLNVQPFDRALIVYDENSVIRMVAYANGSDTGNNYRYSANQYVKNLINPNGAVIEDHLDYQYAYISTNGTGFFPVTVQIGTYYHVVEFRYFQSDGTINGTQLTDLNGVGLSTRVFVEEEDGTVSIDTDDFLTAYEAGNKAVSMYETAGNKVFFYLANYSETGDGHTNTYDTSADDKTVTVSNIGKNAFVNVIVVPYANILTITDNGLNTTSLYYVDASGNDLTNGYKAAGTAPVTYAAGSYRAITGATVTNASINATAEQLAAGVDDVTVSSFTDDATLTLTTISTKHKLTITYIDPWGSTTDTVYPENDFYTIGFTDRTINGVAVTSDDGSTATYTSSGFTVTMPDANTVTNVTVQFRYTATAGTARERLKYDVVNSGQFINTTNSTIATINVTDSYYGVFTINCAKACVAIVDNRDGTYNKLTANSTDSLNTYSFNLDREFPTNIRIIVALRGDLDMDGIVNGTDATNVQRSTLNKRHANYRAISELEKLICNVSDDNVTNGVDAGLIQRSTLKPRHANYYAITWE